jgi:hypothetical protein
MKKSIVFASLVLGSVASTVEAGVLTYSNRQLVAGISNGVTADAVTDSSFDPWFGSRYGTADGLVQFAGFGSSLFSDQFTISANAALSANVPGYGGYEAYSNFTLNFTVTEDAFVTFFLDMGATGAEGAVLVLECMGPSAPVFSHTQSVVANFTRTLAAGDYSLFGSIYLSVPSEGTLLNSGLVSVAANAVAVPAPAALAAFGLLGLAGSRRRR